LLLKAGKNMGIVLIGTLFLVSAMNAGNFPENSPAIFTAYATLAAIKAIDAHVETLDVMKKIMSEYGNHSATNTLATAYCMSCKKLTELSTNSNRMSNLSGALFEYIHNAKLKQRVSEFINILPPVYREIYIFDQKNLISADCGLWSVKAVLPRASSSIESLASLVHDIELYCAAKNPGELFFTKIITTAAAAFTVEKIAEILEEHSEKSDTLTHMYAKNAQIVTDWAQKDHAMLQKELISLKTTNPQWHCVGTNRYSTKALLSDMSGNIL